jgi:hypothetical protein
MLDYLVATFRSSQTSALCAGDKRVFNNIFPGIAIVNRRFQTSSTKNAGQFALASELAEQL